MSNAGALGTELLISCGVRMQVNGMQLEVRWWGSPTPSLPIVLLHEGLGSAGLWRDFPEALAASTGRRVMAYSRFGHGESDPPASPHTTAFMHEEAALLPAILDAAGIHRAILLGHSDGGSIALIAAAESPSWFEALILEAPHVFVEDVSIESIERTTAVYHDGLLRPLLARHHQHVDTAFHGWSDVWLHPEFRQWNLESSLPRITCPILLIQGTDDEYGTIRQIDAIAAQSGGPTEQMIVPQCGHAPHRDQREQVLSRVTAFVRQLA
jgi:pimeloyl-ACP methyl ester carboxylesterase